VVLLGAATEVPRQSESMVLEADGVELWPATVWAPHFSRLALLDAPAPSGSVGEAGASIGEAVLTFERVGHAFSSRWLEEATVDDVARVRRSRPRIPADVDARLLWDTSAGRDLSEGERVALRDGFWRALDEREGRGPAAPPVRPLARPDGQRRYFGRDGDGHDPGEVGGEDGDEDDFAGLYDDDEDLGDEGEDDMGDDDLGDDDLGDDVDAREDGFDDEDGAYDEDDELYDRDDGR
jgi:hypothetical protein